MSFSKCCRDILVALKIVEHILYLGQKCERMTVQLIKCDECKMSMCACSKRKQITLFYYHKIKRSLHEIGTVCPIYRTLTVCISHSQSHSNKLKFIQKRKQTDEFYFLLRLIFNLINLFIFFH